MKPYIRARDPEGAEEIPIPTERIQDVDSAFNIEPDQGTLKANQTTEFTVTFAPPAVRDKIWCLIIFGKGDRQLLILVY